MSLAIALPPAWWHVTLQRALGLICEAPCLGCGAAGSDPLCWGCLARLDPLPARRCARCQGGLLGSGECPLCAKGRVPIDHVFALGQYSGVLRRIIKAMKYKARADLGLYLGERLADTVLPLVDPSWLVVPVPVHRRRRRERGYNQTEPMAWKLARDLALDYDDRALEREGGSIPFYFQGRQQRWDEAKRAFWAHPDRIRGRRVLLVDDILTSGATACAAARALRQAGSPSVCLAVAARATLRRSSLRQWTGVLRLPSAEAEPVAVPRATHLSMPGRESGLL